MKSKIGDISATMKANNDVENSDDGDMSEPLDDTSDEIDNMSRKRLRDEESDDSDSDAQTEILSPKRLRKREVVKAWARDEELGVDGW